MFECVDATQFMKRMGSGKNQPVLLTCEYPETEDEVEVVAKFSNECGYGGLIREAVCAFFAADLGLPVPPSFLVSMSEEFLRALPDPALEERLRKSDRLGFGSKLLPAGFHQWVHAGEVLDAEIDHSANSIMAFDCWTTNGDRRLNNPNLLTNGKSFAIIDHEFALMTTSNLFWQPPWVVGSLMGSPPNNHVFHAVLRARASYPLEQVSAKLAGLSDERIHSYFETLPEAWTASESQLLNEAEAFLRELRDNVSGSLVEIHRALQ